MFPVSPVHEIPVSLLVQETLSLQFWVVRKVLLHGSFLGRSHFKADLPLTGRNTWAHSAMRCRHHYTGKAEQPMGSPEHHAGSMQHSQGPDSQSPPPPTSIAHLTDNPES